MVNKSKNIFCKLVSFQPFTPLINYLTAASPCPFSGCIFFYFSKNQIGLLLTLIIC